MSKENKERNVKLSEKVSNFRKNCPNRIVHTITIIVELLLMLFVVAIIISTGFSENTFYLILWAIVMAMMIYFVIELLIFDLDGKEMVEKSIRILEGYGLSKDEYKEMIWVYGHANNDSIKYIKKTIRNANIKFYAKLIDTAEEGSILISLISKNEKGEILGEPLEINNTRFFTNNFIPKK